MAEKKPTTAETESNTGIPNGAAETDAAAKSTPAAEAEPADAAEAKPRESAWAGAAAAEVADLKEKLLRTLAEMENLRRRTEREIADTRQYAVASFARDMLTVSDNLSRAIDSVPAEARENGDPALKALIEGVEVTARGLQQSLAKIGVKPIDAKGQKFDPEVHQAMFEVDPDDKVPPGTVAQEIQAGYAIGERVLRPAMVAVARKANNNKPAPANDDTAPDEPETAAAAQEDAAPRSGDTKN